MGIADNKSHNKKNVKVTIDNDENLEPDHVYKEVWKEVEAKAKPGHVLYLSRHGESENNVYGKIGGDAALSDNGKAYAVKLADYFKDYDDLQAWRHNLESLAVVTFYNMHVF